MWYSNRSARLAILVAGVALCATAGCQRKRMAGDPRYPGGPAYGFTGEAAGVPSDTRDLPPMIEGLFRDDHPDATLTGARRHIGPDGASTYDLSFVERGMPGRQSYFDDGHTRDLPPRVIRAGERDDYRPAAASPPTTLPAPLTATQPATNSETVPADNAVPD